MDENVSGSIHLLMASVKRSVGEFQMAHHGSASKVKGKEKDDKVRGKKGEKGGGKGEKGGERGRKGRGRTGEERWVKTWGSFG